MRWITEVCWLLGGRKVRYLEKGRDREGGQEQQIKYEEDRYREREEERKRE